jgi:PAS domain S-box-containing protein
MRASVLRVGLRILILAAAYVVGGIVGKASLFMGGTVSLVWPPAGIALGAILVFGTRYWPGVALGSVLFGWLAGPPLDRWTLAAFVLGTAVGNVVGALTCAYLLERFSQFRNRMERVHDVAAFVLFACLMGTTINAAFNVVCAAHAGLEAWDSIFYRMMHWWMANAMAVLVVAPFILAWSTRPGFTITIRRVAEGFLCLGLLGVATLASFSSWSAYGVQNYPLAFLPYPFLVWAALRFYQPGATAGTLIVAAMSILELLRGRGPFLTDSEPVSLMLIGSYIGVLAVTNLLLAAIAAERSQATGMIEDSERRWRAVVEDQTELIWRFDAAGQLTFVNDAFCRFYGRERAALIGGPCPPLLEAGADREITPERFQHLTPESPVAAYDAQVPLPDGHRTWQNCTTRRLFDAAGRTLEFQTVARDISERRQLEEQLRQAQKMEAIGQLAGGVAHDFNNLLVIIKGYATLLLAGEKFEPKSLDALKKILSAAERAGNLTRQLMMFSRKEALRFQVFDLNLVLGDLSKMLRRLIGENITLEFVAAPRPALIDGDTGMMEQVMMNLAVNARDAMPKGGRLRVSLESVEVAEDLVRGQPEARAGHFICWRVQDTGCGIAPEILPRIFEPFFTTKDRGEGSGLGLATVFGIVKQHRGWISVTSLVGKGTTFAIHLPCADDAPGTGGSRPVEAAAQRGSETILMVEDETALREAIRIILEWYGYTVLESANGPDALRLWERHRDAVALLLTDIVLPDNMSGWELSERLMRDKPSLKVIYSTGYVDTVGRELAAQRGVHYLLKPYPPQKLAQIIRECLDRPPPAAGS